MFTSTNKFFESLFATALSLVLTARLPPNSKSNLRPPRFP